MRGEACDPRRRIDVYVQSEPEAGNVAESAFRNHAAPLHGTDLGSLKGRDPLE
jgi:hypothetical protein